MEQQRIMSDISAILVNNLCENWPIFHNCWRGFVLNQIFFEPNEIKIKLKLNQIERFLQLLNQKSNQNQFDLTALMRTNQDRRKGWQIVATVLSSSAHALSTRSGFCTTLKTRRLPKTRGQLLERCCYTTPVWALPHTLKRFSSS